MKAQMTNKMASTYQRIGWAETWSVEQKKNNCNDTYFEDMAWAL